MINKKIAFAAVITLTLGVTTIAYANEKDLAMFNRPNNTQKQELRERRKDNGRDDMFTIMQKYGYGELIDEVENGNFHDRKRV
ncbi:MAG: hypothetical protein K0R15_1743 [Clostridiales bacterium]|nr:hypothetical protein [Clostridiales bacterium]